MCDEFHCLPSEAEREWRQAPAGLLETILEMRNFAALKRMYEDAKTAQGIAALPQGELLELVIELEFERVQANG